MARPRKNASQNVTADKKGTRRLAEDNPTKLYEVTSLVGAALSVEVTDKWGTPIRLYWQQRKSTLSLPVAQIKEIEEKRGLFAKGYLYCPGLMDNSVNTILDHQVFIDSIPENEVKAKIAAITNTDVLHGLYNFVESSRFRVEGTELVANSVAPKNMLVLLAVMDRLQAITGQKYSLQDVD